MTRRSPMLAWARTFERSLKAATRRAMKTGTRALGQALTPVRPPRPPRKKARTTAKVGATPRRPAKGPASAAGTWVPGVAVGSAGARRFWLFRPPGIGLGERLPLVVMLHGCGQDARGFAEMTRMNRIALRERFLVLYPEQDRIANAQGCWNWFDTRSGKAQGEAALIVQAIDQACLLHGADRTRVALAGLSAGASMAALVAERYPQRIRAVVMHSGVAPGSAHSTLSALGAMRGRRSTLAPASPPAGQEATRSDGPALLVIHGAADHVVVPANGEAAAQHWAAAAGARAGPARRVQRGQRYPMHVVDFKRRGRVVASWVAIDGLAHAWSGGAAAHAYSDGRGPDASRMVWAFAARHFRD